MKIAEANAVSLGLYIVHWKDGGTSLAAVGMGPDGRRWLAPTHWQVPSSTAKAWHYVERLERIKTKQGVPT